MAILNLKITAILNLLKTCVCIHKCMYENTSRNSFHTFHQHRNLVHAKDMLHILYFIFYKMLFISLFYLFLSELSSHFSYKILIPTLVG